MRVICAWCKRDMGVKEGSAHVSHGMCPDCSARFVGDAPVSIKSSWRDKLREPHRLGPSELLAVSVLCAMAGFVAIWWVF